MNIVITAPSGKMGKLVVREALKRKDDFTIVGAVGNPSRDYIGKDISVAAKSDYVGANIYANIEEIIDKCDGVIDFSTTELSMKVVEAAAKYGKPLVLGTTGFTEEEENKIKAASKMTAISESHNTSLSVNLIYKIVEMLTKTIGKESDIDIIDYHDNKKLDAPSGTGKVIGKIVADSLGVSFDDKAKFGRVGKGIRGDNEITFHSVRSGNISSSHTVIFGMDGERIELTHHSYDFGTFAKGALTCMLYLKDKKSGMYDSIKCFGLDD